MEQSQIKLIHETADLHYQRLGKFIGNCACDWGNRLGQEPLRLHFSSDRLPDYGEGNSVYL